MVIFITVSSDLNSSTNIKRHTFLTLEYVISFWFLTNKFKIISPV